MGSSSLSCHSQRRLVFVVDACEDFLSQVTRGDVILPVPVALRLSVIERVGPRLSDRLPKVRFEFDHEVRDELLDGRTELTSCEGNTSQVVDMSLQASRIGLQVLHGRLDAVIDVDHRHRGVLVDPALIVTILKGVEEDLSRVVSSAIEREFFAANDSGVSNRPEVHPHLALVVLPDHLVENFADAVDGLWLQDGVDRGLILGEDVSSEGRD